MSDRGGWIVLHRKLLDKPIWFESTAEQKSNINYSVAYG